MNQFIATVFLLLILTGLGAVAYGCYLAWQPLGFIVGGLLLISFAMLINQVELPEGGENK
ncbi:hypothetical protein [Mammaliicoccus sciuri]|uniref:hypothetical protein n=1 Tax=Mammaliicoccus sciuri TaxID=1296 RepID=UPI002DB87521|nr:hypothetical protein [Mammaliicoccus sciuri]MEB5757409.1 hypothetical protein [Mammaliicoccus sciuri]